MLTTVDPHERAPELLGLVCEEASAGRCATLRLVLLDEAAATHAPELVRDDAP